MGKSLIMGDVISSKRKRDGGFEHSGDAKISTSVLVPEKQEKETKEKEARQEEKKTGKWKGKKEKDKIDENQTSASVPDTTGKE